MGLDAQRVIVLIGQILYSTVLMIFLSIKCIVHQFVPYKNRCKVIKGETVLITGAGSGLGKSLAKKMAKLNTKLVLVDIDAKAMEQTEKEIKSDGGEAMSFTCDLSKREDIYKCAEQIKAKANKIDILVNNAGIVTGKRFLESSDAAIERCMNVNVNAHFWLAKCFLPDMVENNHGHIVTVASMAGHFGMAGLGDYCGSKFGAVGFEEAMRYELARLDKTGVKTTVVCPFFINTGMFEGVQSKLIPFLDQEYVTDKMLEAILTNQTILFLPKLMYFIKFCAGFFPEPVMAYFAQHIFGNNESMDTFVGRTKKE